MTLTDAPILLYLVALFLTVATLWIFSYAIETFDPNEIDAKFFLLSIVVTIPFVMLIYFGLAVIINDTIDLGPGTALPLQLSLSSNIPAVAMLTYVGLSAWVWFPWRKVLR
jgi:hypothetical protein